MPGASGGRAAVAAAAKVVARREQPTGQDNELMIHDKRRKKGHGQRPLTFFTEPLPTLSPRFIGRRSRSRQLSGCDFPCSRCRLRSEIHLAERDGYTLAKTPLDSLKSAGF